MGSRHRFTAESSWAAGKLPLILLGFAALCWRAFAVRRVCIARC